MSEQNETEDTLGDVQSWTRDAELKEGTRLDRYQILGLLGKGGMGAVYKAYDPELDRSIAIKILTVKPEEGETASRPQARLMREAQALAKLSHPNVVSVFDVGTFEEGVYIAMEYVKGETLRKWVKDEKPPPKEIIRTLVKAGIGLHAAHTEGIVHRDFKPDNVIIGDKGQVKVLDFGLARAAGTQETAVPDRIEESAEDSTSGEKFLSKTLTRVGAIIGTTVYMAPEHFQFQELDEKTDQFSFCVTLFEALYGKRPFAGKTSEELGKKITSGWIEIPREAHVPKWIEEIICKGLSVSKDDRYASMSQMLVALEDDPEIAKTKRHKKLFVGSLLLLLSAMTVGLAYYVLFKSTKLCTGAEKKIAAIWNLERREQVGRAFSETGLSYSKDTFDRVAMRFDHYLDEWRNQYTETCQATRVRGEQSEEIMDLKVGCLIGHLRTVGALVTVFCDADKTVVSKSVQAVASLSSLLSCSDVRALQSNIPLPKDERTKNRVDSIRRELAQVEALEKTGKFQKALTIAKKLEQESKQVDYRPVQAEVLFEMGSLWESLGDYDVAESTLHLATQAAAESRDAMLAAQIMSLLVGIVGYRQARHEVGLAIARDTGTLLSVFGGDKRIQAGLLNRVGVVHSVMGEHNKALKSYKKALAIQKKMLQSNHPDLALMQNNIGGALTELNDYDNALLYFHEAFTIWEKALGIQHPLVANSLNNMGELFLRKGENKKALRYLLQSLKIQKNVLGPKHPDVARSLNNLGNVCQSQGKYDKALEHHGSALAINEKTIGSDHPDAASSLVGIGDALVAQGRLKQALEPLERSVAICAKKTCDPEPHGKGLFALARALLATGGDKGRQIRLAKQASEVFGKALYLKKQQGEVDHWLKKLLSGKGMSLAKQ